MILEERTCDSWRHPHAVHWTLEDAPSGGKTPAITLKEAMPLVEQATALADLGMYDEAAERLEQIIAENLDVGPSQTHASWPCSTWSGRQLRRSRDVVPSMGAASRRLGHHPVAHATWAHLREHHLPRRPLGLR